MGPATGKKQGTSDPLSYTCSCPAASSPTGGTVLLFYRYFSNTPALPDAFAASRHDAQALAAFHATATARLHLAGKIRVAAEGFNITVGGTAADIAAYMELCVAHWSFAGLALATADERAAFFKPSSGCACVFGPGRGANVRVCAEITPMGVAGYEPRDWGCVEVLGPGEFHRRCHEEMVMLVDVRNHYESRIGYFVDPKNGEVAMRPGIRRFSQWPGFVVKHLKGAGMVNGGEAGEERRRQVMTYCTGGIRCEKATRWMAETVSDDTESEKPRICSLKGGIAAYLTWIEAEVAAGRMQPTESLFKGRNYVFDARGSMGLTSSSEPVSTCHLCGEPSDALTKCRSRGCHLILVACDKCETSDIRCCQSCKELDALSEGGNVPARMCDCEKAREKELWGEGGDKKLYTSGPKSRNKKKVNDLDIRVKVIPKVK